MLPKHLYHYTTLDTLALILKNKTIRFNKLTNTDDLEESLSKDLKNIGRFVFVSCWTDSAEENIPLWSMYSKNMTGVRIRLPFLPFKDFSDMYHNIPEFTFEKHEPNQKLQKMYVHPKHVINSSYSCSPFIGMKEDVNEFRVTYTDDEELLFKKVLKQAEKNTIMALGGVGKHKRKCWEFQNEWRYKIAVYPTSLKKVYYNPDLINQEMSLSIMKMISNYDLPFNHIDLDLSSEALNDFEVTVGPGLSDAQMVIVQALIDKFLPNVIVTKSLLSDKIVPR